jgi:hypothetical protein
MIIFIVKKIKYDNFYYIVFDFKIVIKIEQIEDQWNEQKLSFLSFTEL